MELPDAVGRDRQQRSPATLSLRPPRIIAILCREKSAIDGDYNENVLEPETTASH